MRLGQSTIVVLWLTLLFGQATSAGVASMADIERWYGSGTNHAAVVIDWNEPNRLPLVWGFRWDGSATGEDMFLAIVGAEPALYAKIGSTGSFGTPIYGVGVDRDFDGFELTDGTQFVNGIAITAPSDSAQALDPQDSYEEGWLSAGFWAYYNAASSPYVGGSWQEAMAGAGDRFLSDGSWDGFRFAPDFAGTAPRMPMNLPEPQCGTTLVLTAFLLAMRSGRR